jgi:DNA-binding HxlR family transcriptional regulator
MLDHSMLDPKHFQILNKLAYEKNEITYNKLHELTNMNRKTFHKKLYELVDWRFCERKVSEGHKRGMKVSFRLTKKGKQRVDIEALFVQIKESVENAYKELFEKSVEVKETSPLTGQTTFLCADGSPICIAHFPSKDQKEKLKPFLNSEERHVELGKLINRVIEFYVTEKEHELLADYVPLKESVFAMSFLSKEQSDTMKEAIEKGLFSNYPQIMAQLNFVTERIWLRFWKSLQDPKVLSGEKALCLAKGFRYNPSKKMLEEMPDRQAAENLHAALEEQLKEKRGEG